MSKYTQIAIDSVNMSYNVDRVRNVIEALLNSKQIWAYAKSQEFLV